MKDVIIYKDKNIEIKLKKDMDVVDLPTVAMSCIEAGLIGMKSFCNQAQEPIRLWKFCKRDILEAIGIMEKIIS
jgi:hypothetical protein